MYVPSSASAPAVRHYCSSTAPAAPLGPIAVPASRGLADSVLGIGSSLAKAIVEPRPNLRRFAYFAADFGSKTGSIPQSVFKWMYPGYQVSHRVWMANASLLRWLAPLELYSAFYGAKRDCSVLQSGSTSEAEKSYARISMASHLFHLTEATAALAQVVVVPFFNPSAARCVTTTYTSITLGALTVHMMLEAGKAYAQANKCSVEYLSGYNRIKNRVQPGCVGCEAKVAEVTSDHVAKQIKFMSGISSVNTADYAQRDLRVRQNFNAVVSRRIAIHKIETIARMVAVIALTVLQLGASWSMLPAVLMGTTIAIGLLAGAKSHWVLNLGASCSMPIGFNPSTWI